MIYVGFGRIQKINCMSNKYFMIGRREAWLDKDGKRKTMEGEEEEEGRRKSDQSEVRRSLKQHKCTLSLTTVKE